MDIILVGSNETANVVAATDGDYQKVLSYHYSTYGQDRLLDNASLNLLRFVNSLDRIEIANGDRRIY